MNEYDETKKLLSIIRNIQRKNENFIIKEQEEIGTTDNIETNDDMNVVNDVEIDVDTNDDYKKELKEEEKLKISQLIDDFRKEVSETTEFGKFILYDNGAKLDGKITDPQISFMLSAGDDNGVFLTNLSMVKIEDNLIDIINKLKIFQQKFNSTINDIVVSRG